MPGAYKSSLRRAPRDRLTGDVRPTPWRFVTRAKAMDYNRYGVGLTSPVSLSRGARLKLDLYAPGMILRQVSAEVVSCHRAGQAYRIGLRTYSNLRELAGDARQHQIRYLAGMEEQLSPQG